jgi:hypothetical protein
MDAGSRWVAFAMAFPISAIGTTQKFSEHPAIAFTLLQHAHNELKSLVRGLV